MEASISPFFEETGFSNALTSCSGWPFVFDKAEHIARQGVGIHRVLPRPRNSQNGGAEESVHDLSAILCRERTEVRVIPQQSEIQPDIAVIELPK